MQNSGNDSSGRHHHHHHKVKLANPPKSASMTEEEEDLDDEEEEQPEHIHDHHRRTFHHNTGPSIRAILPQIMNEQNRKTFGTWQRQFDFTRTIVGYLLGIHNFFRFPYLCYKYGGVFFIPYVIMMFIVGIPVVFMEFTIGQYFGVGSFVAFTHMSPILSGVSKVLTWSSAVNCWMYTVILAWLRIYSNDATSCIKGWEVCLDLHYYNTPHCFTGALDDWCNDPTLHEAAVIQEILQNDRIFYNYQCRTVEYYCKAHGWALVPNRKACVDPSGQLHTVYERRYHATQEYFYGAVLGLQRKGELIREAVLVNITLIVSRAPNITSLADRVFILQGRTDIEQLELAKKVAQANPVETVRNYLSILRNSDDVKDQDEYNDIKDQHASANYQRLYWTPESKRLAEDKDSSSYKELQQLSMTTWIMIAVFLFEDLLKVSFLSYILNAVPFVILIYVSTIVVYFNYSGYGIEHIFSVREGFIADLSRLDIWCEAVLQVIYTTGIGNGVLISLATYNNINHNFTIDLYVTLSLAIVTSFCGVLITFCSLGQYLKQYNIDVPFREYIHDESSSSVEFCLVVYSIFLTLISDQNVTIILFFFMLTSFATDTAIRLVQSVLDTVMDMSARFKHHSTLVLIAVCLMGYLVLVPVMRNGGFLLFVDFEYFTVRYVMPTIVLIELGACVFVYKANRILDHSEQMGVYESYSFRMFMTICMHLSFFIISVTIVLNVINHEQIRFNGEEADVLTEMFGWLFFSTPLLLMLLTVLKQLIVVPRSRWGWLLMPLKGTDRKLRRAFLRRIQGDQDQGKRNRGRTDHEELREAALKWRQLESNLILAMMARRKEEKERKDKKKSIAGQSGEEKKKVEATPLLVSLVKIAAAAKKEDEELFEGEDPGNKEEGNGERASKVTFVDLADTKRISKDDEDKDDEEEEQMARNKSRHRRLAFIHVNQHGTCMSRLGAAFMGRAQSTAKALRPKRHAGGGPKRRLVTKKGLDGLNVVNYEEEDDNRSEDSISHDDEDMDEKQRLQYLDAMDYVERWPGRLDESEIESEGSSVDDTTEEEGEVYI